MFGSVDHATEVILAYVYDEGEGKKGGNDVCSLLYRKLEDKGCFVMAKKTWTRKRVGVCFR